MARRVNKSRISRNTSRESSLISTCPKCGVENPKQANFCNECGEGLRPNESPLNSSPPIIQEEAPKIWEAPATPLPFFNDLQFQLKFRPYQAKALNSFDESRKRQSKFHLVAPPGAGKTIIGIELIKRLGCPAVIFSPTTTIQAQWRDKCRLFSHVNDHDSTLGNISMDPKEIKLINALTYQVLSTQSDEKEFLNKLAVRHWKDDLFARQKLDDESAEERINSLEAINPDAHSKEMAHYRERVRRELLVDPQFNVQNLLHPNAKSLIDNLVSRGVRVVILDECHHLLDYWAIIIQELQKKIGNCFTVGLTATPPYSADEGELDNYLALVGKVDFEVPTPAMVKNGDLAPYQDLAYFVTCSERELKFLKEQQAIFIELAKKLSASDAFRQYFLQLLVKHGSQEGNDVSWDDFLGDNLQLCVAAIRYLRSLSVELPKGIAILKEMKEPVNFHNWLTLVESYCLDYLKLSQRPEDEQQLTEIKASLRSLGITLGESGLRKYISPQQRVISLSENKSRAVVEILVREHQSLGERLRAVVITDFEKINPTALRSLKGVLDPESGGAALVLRNIIGDSRTDIIDAVMVTGQSVLLDADIADKFQIAAEDWFKQNDLKASFSIRNTPYPKVSEVTGEGQDWRPRNYVRLITALFEKGVAKCIVSTRGLLGEGWDSLSLNTLIDLTSATTYAMVNQIRGRSIRLDPANPKKLANNWDVVCIVPHIIDGDSDYLRLIRKHDQYFGISANGEIVTGISHLDPELDRLNLDHGLNPLIQIQKEINERAFIRAANRNAAYNLWNIGQPFEDNSISVVAVDREKIKFRTGFTLCNSLKFLLLSITSIIVTGMIVFLPQDGEFWADLYDKPLVILKIVLICGGIGLLVGVLVSSKLIYKYFKQAFIDLPVDSSLRDIGIAVLEALRSQHWISAKITSSNVKVKDTNNAGYYHVYLSGASKADADLFNKCCAEAMEPISDQRYLVTRDATSLRGDFFSPLWHMMRNVTRVIRREEIAYHPVPEIFGKTKETAAAFAGAWGRHVGGGKLVYTRTKEGRKILLKYGLDRRLDLNLKRSTIWT